MSGQFTTADRLRSMLHKPGPYLTAYFDVIDDDLVEQWSALLPMVQHKDVPATMIEAVEARIGLPLEDDVGGWGIIVAADGSTEVFTSPDAPRRPIVNISAIPYMAPALEWDHRDVPHIVVVADDSGVDVVPFVPGGRPIVSRFPDIVAATSKLLTAVRDEKIELVVVGGEDTTSAAAVEHLLTELPPTTLIEKLPHDETLSVDDFTDAVVRQVATVHATRTVNALQEFRFEKSHGAAAEGMSEVLRALRDENIRSLLIHDDPDDERIVAMNDPDDLLSVGQSASTVEGSFADTHAVRLVDAAIASALIHGAEIHIIPTTGRTGPTDDVGVILDDDSADDELAS